MLHIYDALYKQDTMQHVLVRHEQAAVHAADGYARATGDVGVALVTSEYWFDQRGDGHRHGLYGQRADGHHQRPSSNPRDWIGCFSRVRYGGHHDYPSCGQAHFLVKDVRDLLSVMKKAFHIARTGRGAGGGGHSQGRVVSKNTACNGYPEHIEMRSYLQPVRRGHGGQIRKALQLLLNAMLGLLADMKSIGFIFCCKSNIDFFIIFNFSLNKSRAF